MRIMDPGCYTEAAVPMVPWANPIDCLAKAGYNPRLLIITILV